MAADGEIDPALLLVAAQRRNKDCYLPVISPVGVPRLRFKRWRKGEALKTNFYGIAEPRSGPYCPPRTLSLVLMPLVGFDADGNRLGMGKGYYDRTFAFRRRTVQRHPVLLGLAHECQRVEKLEVEAWDLPLDGVVTDGAWYGALYKGR
jgi:5-formyltetrahydrofolate cyclo-ligase